MMFQRSTDRFEGSTNGLRPAVQDSKTRVRIWHIASSRCRAGFGRYRSVKDLGERSARQIYEFTLWPPRPAPAHTPRSPDTRPPSDHRASPIPPDGQFAHARHAPIARRANMPHADALAASGKSQASFRPSRGLGKRGARDRHERWLWDAMDEALAIDDHRGRVRRSRVVLAPRRWR
jgi:hypothetical protein